MSVVTSGSSASATVSSAAAQEMEGVEFTPQEGLLELPPLLADELVELLQPIIWDILGGGKSQQEGLVYPSAVTWMRYLLIWSNSADMIAAGLACAKTFTDVQVDSIFTQVKYLVQQGLIGKFVELGQRCREFMAGNLPAGQLDVARLNAQDALITQFGQEYVLKACPSAKYWSQERNFLAPSLGSP